jgi:hypothetical protein
MNIIPLDVPIGLGFIPGSATSFSLKAIEVSNLPKDVDVILKDNVTHAETDLTDGTAIYQFSPETTSSDCFSVIFVELERLQVLIIIKMIICWYIIIKIKALL